MEILDLSHHTVDSKGKIIIPQAKKPIKGSSNKSSELDGSLFNEMANQQFLWMQTRPHILYSFQPYLQPQMKYMNLQKKKKKKQIKDLMSNEKLPNDNSQLTKK